MRRTWFALIVVAATSLTLLGSFARYNECNFEDWADYFQYRNYCYSDILPLYYIRHLDQDKIPYVDEFSEYPVGTGAITYVVARLTTGLHSYMILTDFFLIGCGFLVAYALVRCRLPLSSQLAYALSPALFAHSLVNWDLAAVACATLGWLAWREDKPFHAAFLFGLGGACKVYPAFFLPFLFLDALRRRNQPDMKRIVGGTTFGLVVPNFVVYLAAPTNWWGIWKFHAKRDPDFETPWPALQEYLGAGFTPEEWKTIVSLVGGGAMLIATLYFAHAQWKRGFDPLVAGGLLTLIFLLVNRVYSPQYTLWALPILILLRAPWVPFWAFIVADYGNYWVRYRLFVPAPPATEGWNDEWMPWSRTFVALRWVFLTWAAIHILVRSRRASATIGQPEARPGPPASEGPPPEAPTPTSGTG